MTNNIGPYFVLLLSAQSLAEIEVQYLRGNSRSNGSTIKDYYFSCSAVGQTLQWNVNRLGLGGFFTGSRAGDLLTSSRPNFTYSSTLLSKGALGNSQVKFISVLLVTVRNQLHLDVACRTEAKQNITSNNAGLNNTSLLGERYDNLGFLQLVLFNNNIVNTNRYTSIFICAVRGSRMMWRASDEYSFQRRDVIGTSWQETFSDDGHNVVKEQVILIAHEPLPFVSLLLVTNYSGNAVECGSDGNISLHLSLISHSSQTSGTDSPMLSSSTTSITPTVSSAEVSGRKSN